MSAPTSAPASGSTTPTTASSVPRHAQSATDKQRAQLERLLRDPSKPAAIPAPPQAKTVRPAREMMKNVQGSSAGAGSGEFHVYKASRRREYERLQLMEEEAAKEAIDAEFQKKREEWSSQADAKTAKNRAKRQKKKERSKAGSKAGADNKGEDGATEGGSGGANVSDIPLKKRRLVNGAELVFRRPGEQDDEDGDEVPEAGPAPPSTQGDQAVAANPAPVPIVETPRLVIYDD